LEEIRDEVGQPGQINETLSQFLSWESKKGFLKKSPRIKVHVSPLHGKTRIKITKFPSFDGTALTTAAIVGGGILGMGILGAGMDGNAAGAGVLFGLGTVGAAYGVTRAWFRARIRRQSRALARLLDRLSGLVRDYDAPALPGRPRSRADEESDIRTVVRDHPANRESR
jgi:hypothetical protein